MHVVKGVSNGYPVPEGVAGHPVPGIINMGPGPPGQGLTTPHRKTLPVRKN